MPANLENSPVTSALEKVSFPSCTHFACTKVMLKILQVGFNSTWTENFQVYKIDLEKAEGPEIKLPTSAGS